LNILKIFLFELPGELIQVGHVTYLYNVATMWKEHFAKLYNSNVGNKYRSVFQEKIKNFSDVSFTSLFSLMDVRDTISMQKCGKARVR